MRKQRDLWNSVHGQKLCAHCLRQHLHRPHDRVLGVLDMQRGFRAHASAGEAAGAAVYQLEAASTLCDAVGRSYIDLKGFFMGIDRGWLHWLEGEIGVDARLTDTYRGMHGRMEGRATTAFGLTAAWRVARGTGQGDICAPVRSTLQLLVTMLRFCCDRTIM